MRSNIARYKMPEINSSLEFYFCLWKTAVTFAEESMNGLLRMLGKIIYSRDEITQDIQRTWKGYILSSWRGL